MEIKQIHKRILEELKTKKLYQKDMVKDLGLTQTGFRQMFENDSLKVTTLLRIATWLDVSVGYLIGISEKQIASTPSENRFAAIEERLNRLEEG